jgi:hypothetical protein
MSIATVFLNQCWSLLLQLFDGDISSIRESILMGVDMDLAKMLEVADGAHRFNSSVSFSEHKLIFFPVAKA